MKLSAWWRQPRLWLWGLALALLLAVLANVPLADVRQVLLRLSWPQVLALVVVNAVALASMSGRWWLIVRSHGLRVGYLTLAGYRLAAFGVSYFTPGPHFGGEPLQVHLLRRHHRAPLAVAVATVTLDKLIELLVNFSFLALGVLVVVWFGLFPEVGRLLLFVPTLALLGLPAGLLLTVSRGRRPFSSLLRGSRRLLVAAPRQQARVRWQAAYYRLAKLVVTSETQVIEASQRGRRTLLLALAASLGQWLLLLVEYWLALYFLGATLTPAQTIIALTAGRIAILLPLPAGLGTLEASQVLAMQSLGFDPAIGLSLSLLIRLRDVLLGLAGLWWGGLKM